MRKTITSFGDDALFVRRPLPDPVIKDRPLFAGDLSKSIPVRRLVEHNDVTITAEGILYKNGSIMAESFARAENFRRFKRKRTFRRYEDSVKSMPVREAASVVWVTDDWSKGYFHWLADVLPKLVIAADYLETSTLLLPARFRESRLVKDSLDLFGVRDYVFVGENEAVKARRLFIPFHTPHSGEFDAATIREVRRILTSPLAQSAVSDRRVYISRAGAKRRKVLNEGDVIDLLGGVGFDTVYAEDLSFAEQIRLFSSVRHLVSIHGAGLANMLFMPEGGRVLEFRKNDPRSPDHFVNMAAALGHEYHCQSCPSDDEPRAPYSADLIVDVRSLRRNLGQFLDEK